jgi:hypothetical protein
VSLVFLSVHACLFCGVDIFCVGCANKALPSSKVVWSLVFLFSLLPLIWIQGPWRGGEQNGVRPAYLTHIKYAPLYIFYRDDIVFVDLNPSQEYRSVKYTTTHHPQSLDLIRNPSGIIFFSGVVRVNIPSSLLFGECYYSRSCRV